MTQTAEKSASRPRIPQPQTSSLSHMLLHQGPPQIIHIPTGGMTTLLLPSLFTAVYLVSTEPGVKTNGTTEIPSALPGCANLYSLYSLIPVVPHWKSRACLTPSPSWSS